MSSETELLLRILCWSVACLACFAIGYLEGCRAERARLLSENGGMQVTGELVDVKAAKKSALDAGKTVSDWLRELIRRETKKGR